MMRRGWFLLVLVSLALMPALAQAQGGQVTPDDVMRVAKKLYCPICPNTPLDVCETQACEDWRDLIRQKLEAGESEEEIIAYFVSQYGEQVLALPPARGFNLLGWFIPLVILVAGLIFLITLFRNWSRRRLVLAPSEAVDESMDDLPPEYLKRLEQELEDY